MGFVEFLQVREATSVFKDKRGKTTWYNLGQNHGAIGVSCRKAKTWWGGHYHKEGYEVIIVLSGQIILCLAPPYALKEVDSYELKEGQMFAIPYYVAHKVYIVDSTKMIEWKSWRYVPNQEDPNTVKCEMNCKL